MERRDTKRGDTTENAEDGESTDATGSLPRIQRVQTSLEFRHVKDHGRRYRTDVLRINYLATTREHSRLGLVVSKRHGNAVRRNRIKRLLRAAFRHTKHELPSSFDLVLLPSSGPRTEEERRQDGSAAKRTKQRRRTPKRERPKPPDYGLADYVASLHEFAAYLHSKQSRDSRTARAKA